jgi:glycosyltransferase involved in cell wall biosynthesis
VKHLLLTSQTPRLSGGAGLRTYGVAAALARHDDVEVAYIAFGADEPAPEYAGLERVTMRRIEASRGAMRAVEYARARLRRIPAALARGVSRELVHGADDAGQGVRVIADGPIVAAGLLPLARRREVVYLAHNFESGFRREFAREGLERFERQLLQTFDETWMATRADERDAAALAGDGVKTRYVPNVIDVARIEPVAPAGASRILFVADFRYAPNQEALAYLIEHVLPLAWASMPELRVTLVGRGLREPPADERVEALGFVEDLRDAYASVDAVAVPLLRGGGSPLKLIEALAYGLPVVATLHAARLLEDAVPGEHLVAAGEPAEFAAAIAELLTDPVRGARLGAAGRELAQRSYSVDALAALLAP